MRSFNEYPKYTWIEDWSVKATILHQQEPCSHEIKALLGPIGTLNIENEKPISLLLDMEMGDQIIHLCDSLLVQSLNNKSSIEIIILNTGVLFGRITGRIAPILTGEKIYTDSEYLSRIELSKSQLVYHREQNYFCCMLVSNNAANISELIQKTYEVDFNEELQQRLQLRTQQLPYLNQSKYHNILLLLCMEKMMASLQPANEKIPGIWAISDDAEPTTLNVNTMLVQILAWIPLNIDISVQMLQTLFQIQTSSGLIPSEIKIYGVTASLAAPKPILCQVCEEVLIKKLDPVFAESIIPQLIRYLRWILSHFDPTYRGLHSWRNQSETITPEIFKPELATADLTALLLNEIECFERILLLLGAKTEIPKDLLTIQNKLKSNLKHLFWNKDEKDFSNAFIRGEPISIKGYNPLLPMLCNTFIQNSRSIVLERLKSGEIKDSSIHVSTWRKTDLSDQTLSVIQKLLFIRTLRKFDSAGSVTYDYIRLAMNGFVDWFISLNETKKILQISQKNAAYVVQINQEYERNYQTTNKWLNVIIRRLKRAKVDRIDFAIVGITLLLVLSIRLIYSLNEAAPPYSSLKTEMIAAYNELDMKHIYESANKIIQSYPDQSSLARLYIANIYLQSNQYKLALSHIEYIREMHPDSPGPMLIHAMTLHHMEKYIEADQVYYEFCYLFDAIFPDIVNKASLYRFLIKEDLELPQNWIELYKYRIFHEI